MTDMPKEIWAEHTTGVGNVNCIDECNGGPKYINASVVEQRDREYRARLVGELENKEIRDSNLGEYNKGYDAGYNQALNDVIQLIKDGGKDE